jgi:dihydrodipicolinate synthase/N-acetylneuraminate lyase
VKAALELLGFAVGDPRLPLVPATAAERSSVRAALERRGLPVRA